MKYYDAFSKIGSIELPTNLQNFTQKNLTEVKIFQKVLWGGYFFWNTRYTVSQKVSCLMFDNNFGKCGPIFNILSPGDS